MIKPEVKIGYEGPQFPSDMDHDKRSDMVPFKRIAGQVRYTTSAPTWTPRKDHLEEQFAIYYSGTGLNFCIYNFPTAQWNYLDLSTVPF